MKKKLNLEGRFGILGGGQLGKMLCQAASAWHIDTYVMESNSNCPAGHMAHHFVKGDITKAEDVLDFGRHLDFLTIEIENVSVEGLQLLEEKGVKVYPSARTLSIIKDKAKQNSFYNEQGIPSPEYKTFSDAGEIRKAVSNEELPIPFVQKLRTEGYDGRGVHIVNSQEDMSGLLDGLSIVETAIEIDKELAMIVARNPEGEIKTYDAVEMVFHPEANLVEYLQAPASIAERISEKMEEISITIIEALDHCGILAIEFFLDKKNTLWVNEMAPRPHNSGHHTIEACECSQYEQLVRSVMNLPLGDSSIKRPAVMINLLGEAHFRGVPIIEGLDEILNMPDAHLHWYGKKQTRPHRKMGHISCTGNTLEEAKEKALVLKEIAKVKA
ncbi:MAG: 5-(carboxyamino)imidazole ribonucleotide synthase [Bacteroidetes bacterium]|jgi:5-(carboxyamino)imidazole ribonucleotide synthase|nr:5-(carboxyamino)imidazole ribonucleotide synthase [Bacteroidota bacterium]